LKLDDMKDVNKNMENVGAAYVGRQKQKGRIWKAEATKKMVEEEKAEEKEETKMTEARRRRSKADAKSKKAELKTEADVNQGR